MPWNNRAQTATTSRILQDLAASDASTTKPKSRIVAVLDMDDTEIVLNVVKIHLSCCHYTKLVILLLKDGVYSGQPRV